jgi:DNA-binding MarR family transcriptional regulator
MDQPTKLSEREKLCLQTLAMLSSESEYGDDMCTYFRVIAEQSGLEEKQTRRSVRSLVRKGLAKYVRGLFDEDGMVAGSGHCLTPEGRKLADDLLL